MGILNWKCEWLFVFLCVPAINDPCSSSEYLSEGLIKTNKHFSNKLTHIFNDFIEVSNVVISRDNCFLMLPRRCNIPIVML